MRPTRWSAATAACSRGRAPTGRRCRRLREALQRGEGVRAELLNYRKDGSPFWNSFTISPVLDGEGQLTHFVGVQTDVTARVIAGIEYERLLAAERDARTVAERARGRLDVIVEVGAVLTETLDATDAMRRLAAALVPAAADYCVIDLMEQPVGLPVLSTGTTGSDPAAPPPETLRVADDLLRNSRRVAAAHEDEDLAAALAAMRILPAGAPDVPGVALPAVALTGAEPVVRNDLREAEWAQWAEGDPDALALAARLRTSAAVIAPMRARGRVIGALTLGHTSDTGRRFDDQDVDLARTVAARAALAVDNALLLEAETEQRRRADALAAAGAALAASGLRSSDAVEVLLDQVVPALGDHAFVHVDEHASAALRPPGAGPGLQLVRARAVGDAVSEWTAAAGGPGPGAAWSTGRRQVMTVDAGAARGPSGRGRRPARARAAAGRCPGRRPPDCARHDVRRPHRRSPARARLHG